MLDFSIRKETPAKEASFLNFMYLAPDFYTEFALSALGAASFELRVPLKCLEVPMSALAIQSN